jgi:hypothetical protein
MWRRNRAADPHRFSADSDPAFTWMLFRIRILLLLLVKVRQICCSTVPRGLHFEPSRLHCERPRLHFEPLQLLTSFSL